MIISCGLETASLNPSHRCFGGPLSTCLSFVPLIFFVTGLACSLARLKPGGICALWVLLRVHVVNENKCRVSCLWDKVYDATNMLRDPCHSPCLAETAEDDFNVISFSKLKKSYVNLWHPKILNSNFTLVVNFLPRNICLKCICTFFNKKWQLSHGNYLPQ